MSHLDLHRQQSERKVSKYGIALGFMELTKKGSKNVPIYIFIQLRMNWYNYTSFLICQEKSHLDLNQISRTFFES